MRKRFLPLLFVTLLSACNKNDEGYPDGWANNPAEPDLSMVLAPNAPQLQSFTLTAGVNVITTARGIQFTIPDQAFTNNGNVVSNEGIAVLVTEYWTNKELVGDGLSTGTGLSGMLINGGAYNISVSNPYLLKKPIAVSMPEVDANFNTDFKVYRGFQALAGATLKNGYSTNIGWSLQAGKINWSAGTRGAVRTYEYAIADLGWYLLGKNTVPSQPVTDVTIDLPDGYGNVNTRMYLLVPENGMRQAYGNLDQLKFDLSSVPEGLSAKILTISIKDSRYHYDLRRLTINKGELITITDLPEISKAALTDVIATQLN